jgi:hypothetical protein
MGTAGGEMGTIGWPRGASNDRPAVVTARYTVTSGRDAGGYEAHNPAGELVGVYRQKKKRVQASRIFQEF